MSRRKQVKNPATSTRFDQANEVRAIARERVGVVKASQAILPKTTRKKPKHKNLLDQE